MGLLSNAEAEANFDAFMRFHASTSQENLAENSGFKRSNFPLSVHVPASVENGF